MLPCALWNSLRPTTLVPFNGTSMNEAEATTTAAVKL